MTAANYTPHSPLSPSPSLTPFSHLLLSPLRYIMDRKKDIIIRGGENISCGEVESSFYEHPSVMEVRVYDDIQFSDATLATLIETHWESLGSIHTEM